MFSVQCLYTYGWDDAGWTEDVNGTEEPLRFASVVEARRALYDFFRSISKAVDAGDIDFDERKTHYRIVDEHGEASGGKS